MTTNQDGQFTVSVLPVATYRLVVTSQGFSKAEAPDVKVSVTETTNVVIPLQVGRVEESVTVTDTATTVQLSMATTGQTLAGQTVGQLPLSTRNFLTLLTLSTGANTFAPQFLASLAAVQFSSSTVSIGGRHHGHDGDARVGVTITPPPSADGARLSGEPSRPKTVRASSAPTKR